MRDNNKILIMYGNHIPTREHILRLSSIAPEYTIIHCDTEEKAIMHAPEVTIILGHRYLRQTLPYAKKVQWVQSTAHGVEHLVTTEFLQRKPILTNAPIFGDHIALHALTLAFSCIRNIPLCVRYQQNGVWHCDIPLTFWPKKALIVGVGHIGKALAVLLQKIGLNVIGVDQAVTPAMEKACNACFPTKEIDAVLPTVDICFCCMSLSEKTRSFFNNERLSLLPKHAFFIDISRQGIVDIEALLYLLSIGKLQGAALDVLDYAQYPSDHYIWQMENILVTPKQAALSSDRWKRLEPFMESQVFDFVSNRPLQHQQSISKLINRSQ